MKAISTDAQSGMLSRKDSGERIVVVTPEGIPLNFRIAHSGDRAAAFFLDYLFQTIAIIVLVLLMVWGSCDQTLSEDSEVGGQGWVAAFVVLVAFLLQTFYFTWFEIRWQGTTPGKRRLGLRVIDRHGGPLTTDAVIVRNFTRVLEFTLPMQVLLMNEQVWPTAPGWARGVAVLWLLVFACMPMFNKHRLRIGDMVAGTMVVLAPKTVLLEDQTLRATAPSPYAPPGSPAAAAQPQFTFSDEQLDIYGIFELQVLEEVLRKAEAGGLHDIMALDTVAEKIKMKLKWPRERWRVEPERFLRDFYAALRARLEHKMLLGERKEDKNSK
jgi:uncharacterized RDD family membrane protein YckC